GHADGVVGPQRARRAPQRDTMGESLPVLPGMGSTTAGTDGMPRRTYDRDFKAEALAALDANAGNAKRTARQLGVLRGTLRRRTGQGGRDQRLGHLRHRKKEVLADALERVAYRILDVQEGPAGRRMMEEASLPELMGALGMTIDKMLKLRRDQSRQ